MKNNRLFKALMLVLISFTWTSCHKDKEMDGKDPVVSNEEMTVSSTEACFSWKVDFTGEFHTGVELSQNENMIDVRRVEATKQEEKFVAVVSDLSMGKKYYYRIVVWNKFNNYEEKVKSFSTTQTFAVTLACLPEEGGTATGGGTFAAGDTCTVTAAASEGFTFAKWTENGNQVSTEAEYSFEVTSDRNLVANFNSSEYTITATADPETGGTVSGGGEYSYGNECTLKATSNEGYTFVNWTENGEQVSSNAEYHFSVTCNRILVAHFTSQAYVIHVDVDPENSGTVIGAQGYNYGDECTLKAIANEGYNFVNWTKDGTVVSTNYDYTFTVTGSATFVAHFQAINYHISVSANPNEGGTVSGGGDFHYGDECTVTAVPNEGYTFANWTENGNVVSTEATYSFVVYGDRDLAANFATDAYTIDVSANPANGGNVTGGGTYSYGQSCTVTAMVAQGYTFNGWTENGTQVSADASYTFQVTGNRTLVAQFQAQSYIINASANPTDGGIVTGGGTYYEGESCTVTATANSGYDFTNWTEGGNVVSTYASYTFTVTGNRTLVANFSEQPTYPTGAINSLFTVNSEGDQVYFSQGNLQYQASTNIWRFSENQWDYVGNESNGTVYENGVKCNNSQISSTYDGWIDLFGFGTSGYDHGANCYLPWSTSQNYWDYYAYGNGQANLYDQSGKADWGYNAIYNGGNIENSGWRTLTNEEWIYVFRDRVSEIRYVRAKVNDVNGMILLPDNWSSSYYPLENINPPLEVIRGCNYENNIISFEDNIISSVDWFNSFEANGAVFLPAAGGRGGTSVYSAGGQGYYRTSSSSSDVIKVRVVFFNSATFDIGFNDRWRGFCVRLVRNVQ